MSRHEGFPFVSTMSPRLQLIFGDPGGLAQTRSCRKNRLQSAASLEKGCAVADLDYSSFTPSNPVSQTNLRPGFPSTSKVWPGFFSDDAGPRTTDCAPLNTH